MSILEDNKARIAELKKARGTPSKTKQSFKAQANINNIMAEFHQTGIMPNLKEKHGLSQINPSNGLDYHQQMTLARQHQQSYYDGSFQPDIKQQPEYHDKSNIPKALAFKP